DEAELIESVTHYKNKLYSKGVSRAVARGLRSPIKAGRQPTSSCTPYGYDRLYFLADGHKTLLIRTMPGNVKHKLDPNNGASVYSGAS
ncbi:MAG TPA: hypothetical protein VF669_15880, partial [Tepidisphaeraceae bacterium]